MKYWNTFVTEFPGDLSWLNLLILYWIDSQILDLITYPK